MVFTKGMFGFFVRGLLGCASFWRHLWGKTLWLFLTFARGRNEDFEYIPQGTGAEHVGRHIQWTAYGDVEGQDHDESAEAKQKASNQPQCKCLVHREKCDPVCDPVQPLLDYFFFKNPIQLGRVLTL